MPFKMEDHNNFQVEQEQGQQTTGKEGSDMGGRHKKIKGRRLDEETNKGSRTEEDTWRGEEMRGEEGNKATSEEEK